MANHRREDLQRAAILHLIHRHRYGIRQAARILGVPRSTVMDWKRQGPDGIQNARLRMIAQKAVDGLQLLASEEAEVAALFATRAETNKSARDRAEGDNKGQDSQEGQDKAQDDAEDTADDNSSSAARAGPGEPLPPATDEAGIPLLPEDTAPPILDKLNLLAWHRYFTLLQNDVAHHHAVDAVTQIDPDFSISDEQAKRALHALGKGDQPVKFAANWSAGSVAPPQYVQDVYAQFQWDAQQEQQLADYLYRIATENYLAGINDSLLGLEMPLETSVTDPMVLDEIRAEARLIAEGIGQTFNRDLAAETATRWVELSAERGKQMSRRWLEEAVRGWALARADWKATQIAGTETSRWRNRGAMDFMDRNLAAGAIMVEKVDVVPYAAECQRCVELVNGAPYNPDDPILMDVPLHPSCVHILDPVMVPAERGDLASGLWTAQDLNSGVEAA